MYLVKISEALVKGQKQELHISTERSISSRDEARDLGYDDFIAVVYINGESRGEISNLLNDAGVWQNMIDDIDWELMFVENYHDQLEERAYQEWEENCRDYDDAA